uniref:ATP-dependent DNA helicase n=1 Tax=Fusarium oxysporum (strain Fo5176) TaxID=660025 RepID=A0A0D2Y8C6_FUSOF
METESLSDLFRRLDAQNRENVALAGLGIRTSADIFEAIQSQYEHSRSQRNEAYGWSVVSPALVDLGIRTSADILEALNGENGQKSGDMSSRRRHRLHRKPGIMSSGQGQVVDSAEGTVENGPQEEPRHRSELKRSGPRSDDGQLPHKRPRTVERQERSESEQVQDLANVLGVLEEDFAEKERLSDDQTWCTPVSHERKAKTVEEFYKAFHDMRTLPVLTCMFCYPKHSRAELQFSGAQTAEDTWGEVRYRQQRGCTRSLGCEHMFPDELKDLTPVEEKLIALNSCYGFITKHSVSDGHRQGATYPRHVKGHITVFPNNVQELATNVLPHPLLKVMDDVHISWQGQEKPAPSDLSTLLSVRRNAVEKALLWLKRHNPLYADIEIDEAELDSWDAPSHGVPSQVFDRLERNEPSAREKMQTVHIVPPTERDIDDHEPADNQEIMASLAEGLSTSGEPEVDGFASGEDGDDWVGNNRDRVDETESSGMFNLDGRPDIPDAEKLRYLVKSMAKTFPSLFPLGKGGPRQAEEHSKDATGQVHPIFELEAAAQHLVSSRNMSLEAWVKMVIQRHGGRFATHPVFPFLVFNIGVRSRNRRVNMASMRRSDFPDVERTIQDLTASRLEKARGELEACGKTADPDVNRLLRNLSLYGYRQPMSRESRLTTRRKIKSLIIRYGIPAIWFTLNPNDITNPIKLKLAAYRTRETDRAEEYLRSLDQAYKRARLAISDPLSSAIFFHREISMFFQYYVMVGKDSVFGRVSQYYGAVETNERGALHLHGLLWLQGNMYLSSLLSDVQGEEQAAYRQRVTEYVDSVFTEDLDEESFARVRTGRSVTSDVSSLLERAFQFPPTFEEEANFCAGATQIHTHSPTCVKYAIGRRGTKQNPCRFGAPWKPVEKTYFDEDGLLRLRRSHSLVNRWNKVMAVGLRHNHDISFIVTKCKGLALVYYVTNYATKVEDPVWKRVVAAKDLIRLLGDRDQSSNGRGRTEGDNRHSQARRFLLRMANRIFTERALSQVEVLAHFQGYETEFTNSTAWTFLNVYTLYWLVVRFNLAGRDPPAGAAEIPRQEQLRSIKSQQNGLFREREKMVQGLQNQLGGTAAADGVAAHSRSDRPGQQDNLTTHADQRGPSRDTGPSTGVMFSPDPHPFARPEGKWPSEGGTGKSRVIAAIAELFVRTGQSHRLLLTATSGTAAANINGITIHSACRFSKDTVARVGRAGDPDGFASSGSAALRIDGQTKMDWQEKQVLIIDEVSMLGARTLHAVNEQLCRLRESARDFGGIPIVIFCGDFHQFRPVQERSILLPSASTTWEGDNGFGIEQRRQHDMAHALWRKFTTVVLLDEQVRAAQDPRLRGLLTRIRKGVQDQSDVEYLNSHCYQEGRRIPWESGITVVTPLNRNRWNLNIEATLAFRKQWQRQVRIFVSEHRWKDNEPTEEEAIMMLGQGDDSTIPVPAIFMFVPGMPVVVNKNTHQGLKLVNGASYTAQHVILDKAHPGHQIDADTVLHFGPPAGILLGSETTRDFRFIGMPPGTVLLTPTSVKIECQRKRPWQQVDVSRRGLPCAPAFACTDYKVQGRTLDLVALELRGTRTTNIDGQAVPSQCDPYSLYVQLSRCRTLDGIMLLSRAREHDLIGNTVPAEMAQAELRLEQLSEETLKGAESRDWLE